MNKVKCIGGDVSFSNQIMRDIGEYINQYKEEDYKKIIEEDLRVAVFEALTDRRRAEFAWYDFGHNATVLEIGAGWGEFTGFLCNSGCRVTAIEQNALKAEALAKRHGMYESLRVCAGDWRNLPEEYKYDFIVVHEFESIVAKNEYGLRNGIEILMARLKPQGHILLNIANKYSARYLCGEPRSFAVPEFCELNKGEGVSRSELLLALTAIPNVKYKLYYPMGDRNKPRCIFSDAYLPTEAMLREIEFYRRGKNLLLNDVRSLYDASIREGWFRNIVDAYMVEVTFADAGLYGLEYAKISADRPRELAMVTMVFDKQVEKRPIHKAGIKHIENMMKYREELCSHGIPVVNMRLHDDCLVMPRIRHRRLGQYLRDLAVNDRSAFLQKLRDLYTFICHSSEIIDKEKSHLCMIKPEADWGPVLKHAYIELIDLNCFWNGEFLFFDQEYMREAFPAKYIMYREIINLYYAYPEIEDFIKKEATFSEFGMEGILEFLENEEYNVFLAGMFNQRTYIVWHLPHDDGSLMEQKRMQKEARRECYLFAGCANKTLVIMGSGARFIQYMRQYGRRFSPDLLIDNNAEKWGSIVCDKEIFPPSKLTELVPSQTHIIICVKDYDDIEAQMLKMGFFNYRVF